MKKTLLMLLIGCMLLSMTACGHDTESNMVVTATEVETTEKSGIGSTEANALQGIRNLKQIPVTTFPQPLTYLWYDTVTQNVYIWNGDIDGRSATVPSPYYAPNGHPYKYNPETNTLEENEIR